MRYVFHSTSYHILQETQSRWALVNILDLRRLRIISDWFDDQDEKTKMVLVAGINAQYDKWANFTPITVLITPFVTIFFTFIIAFSIAFINIGTNVTLDGIRSQSIKSDKVTSGEPETQINEIVKILDTTLNDNVSIFMEMLLTIGIICVILISFYYWRVHRLAKLKNLINLCYEANKNKTV